MNNDDAQRFLEELADSGGDLDYWIMRKDRENSSFYGLEIDPEKEKRLNTLKDLCARLTALDKDIIYRDNPLTHAQRHGGVQISMPPLFFTTDGRVSDILSRCFALADYFTIAAPRLIDEEAGDEDFTGNRKGREVVITFDVEDMWKIYGKAPFI